MGRKRANRYHHGDLSRALLEEAIRTIHRGGVEALTLRGVGERIGVSRTALYRHFAHKSALLAAVAREGFHALRMQLLKAWDAKGGAKGFEAMGAAYVRFAVANPSHYRVMFGGYVDGHGARDPDLAREGAAAFQTLVDAVVSLERQGLFRPDHPKQLAQYIWANVHGIAMLAIDGQLKQPVEEVIRYANRRIRTGIAR